jgi:hypothetical protein
MGGSLEKIRRSNTDWPLYKLSGSGDGYSLWQFADEAILSQYIPVFHALLLFIFDNDDDYSQFEHLFKKYFNHHYCFSFQYSSMYHVLLLWKLILWRMVCRDVDLEKEEANDLPEIKVYNYREIKDFVNVLDPHSIFFKLKDLIDFIENIAEVPLPKYLRKKYTNRHLHYVKWPVVTRLYTDNETDLNIMEFMKIPDPIESSFLYSKEHQKGILQEANKKHIQAIKLYDLVFIMATEVKNGRVLKNFWSLLGLNDDDEGLFPKWNYLMADNYHAKALSWFWILCRMTMNDEYQNRPSYFFYRINNKLDKVIPKLYLYKIKNNELLRVDDGVQSPNQYIKFTDLKSLYLEFEEDNYIHFDFIDFLSEKTQLKPEADIPSHYKYLEKTDSGNQLRKISFFKDTDFWRIGVFGQEKLFKDIAGLRFLYYLILNVDQELSALHIYHQGTIPLEVQHLDNPDGYQVRSPSEYKRVLDYLEEKHQIELDIEKRDTLRQDIINIKKIYNSDGLTRFKTDADKCRQNVYKSIKEAVGKLNKELPEIKDLFNFGSNQIIKTGNSFGYLQTKFNIEVQWVLNGRQ